MEYILALSWTGAAVGSAVLAWGTWDFYHKTLKGLAEPHLVTYLVWFIAPMVAFTVTLLETRSLQPEMVLTFMVGACPGAILVAMWRKSSLQFSKLDKVCLVLSGSALVAYWFTGQGTVGVSLAILADLIAAWPTLQSAFKMPHMESTRFFGSFLVASTITLLFVALKGEGMVATCAFAIYLIALYAVLFVLVKTRVGERLRQSPSSQPEVTPGA